MDRPFGRVVIDFGVFGGGDYAPAVRRRHPAIYTSDEEDTEELEAGPQVVLHAVSPVHSEEELDTDPDSGYESLYEEEDGDQESEDKDAENADSPAPSLQQSADVPSLEVSRLLRHSPEVSGLSWDLSNLASIPAFFAPDESKYSANTDEEGPWSKRPCWTYSEDIPEDPALSTSAGTSGFTRYFHYPLDSDDSDDHQPKSPA